MGVGAMVTGTAVGVAVAGSDVGVSAGGGGLLLSSPSSSSSSSGGGGSGVRVGMVWKAVSALADWEPTAPTIKSRMINRKMIKVR